MTGAPRLHAAAWLGWVAAAAVALTATRNPWLLGLVLLWIGVTLATVRPHTEQAGLALSPWRFGLFVVPVAALFNALFVHAGTTKLFTLPQAIPLLGGAVTLEALVYGALNGLVLTGLFAAFVVFNRATLVRDLIQLAPRAYYPVAVTVAIAVTFVPATLRQAEQIREAQAIRGHRMRGLRSWGPIFLPLLSSGLERAMHLAEAMVARGFATGSAGGRGVGSTVRTMRTQGLLVGGLLLFLAGWLLRLGWGLAWIGGAALAAGLLLMGLAIRLAGRNHPHTVYRRAPWQAADWLVAALAAATVALFLLPLPWIDRSALAWYPYPTLTPPSFSLALGLATWGLLGPAALYLSARE